ncbi:YceH family protein [Massilia sp. B-10]|nr:YceH family protein [Massilia sp. B-10]
MSLNAITNGCNQLSSRDPVMQLSDETVQEVLQSLMQRKYVNGITQASARDQVRTPDARQMVARSRTSWPC